MLDKPSEEIKQRINIIDIIGEYVQLKKTGQNYRACCPFHNEKTPSFMVSEDKQIFKCFGCGEGGDIFSFITKIEGIEFIDALKLLADKAGVELKKQDPKIQSKRNKTLEVLDIAAKFFNKALFESKEGVIARDYLSGRKIEDLTQDEFMIGYSPDSWDMLTKFLKKKGFQDEEIIESGLVVSKDNGLGYYDRFRGRLMFPIWDVHGNVIGFGGRVLSGDEKQAKYVNSPQGLIYDKSKVLYGINKAKQEIRKEDKIIIVEGYTDVIASHQVGIRNVVSASGTALTSDQIDLIKRYTGNMILSFDMDNAGDMATKRGIAIAQNKGMNIKILQLPQGKDPDECIRENVKNWQESIERAKSIMDYYFDSTLNNLDLEKVEDKKAAAASLLTQIKNIPDKIEQTHYLQKLANILNVDEKILQESINKSSNERKYENNRKTSEKKQNAKKEDKEENVLARRLISLYLGQNKLLSLNKGNEVEIFLPKEVISLYRRLQDEYNNLGNSFDINKFIAKLEKENQEIAFLAKEFLLYFEKEFKEDEEIVDFEELKREAMLIFDRLKRIKLNKRLENIKGEIKKAEDIGDNDKIKLLSSEIGKILSQFR